MVVHGVLDYLKLQTRILLEIDYDYWMRLTGFDGKAG